MCEFSRYAIKVNASVAESIYLPLMFPSVPVYCVINLYKRYLRAFILLLIIGSVDSKNIKAITEGGNRDRKLRMAPKVGEVGGLKRQCVKEVELMKIK